MYMSERNLRIQVPITNAINFSTLDCGSDDLQQFTNYQCQYFCEKLSQSIS